MSASIGFHPLVQKELNEILEYYETEAGLEVADRFETEFRLAIAVVIEEALQLAERPIVARPRVSVASAF